MDNRLILNKGASKQRHSNVVQAAALDSKSFTPGQYSLGEEFLEGSPNFK